MKRWPAIFMMLSLPLATFNTASAADDDTLVPPAQKTAPPSSDAPAPAPIKKSWFAPPSDPYTPRSDIWVPLVSFILPGFGQFANEEYAAGSAYAGVAIAGYAYAESIYESDHVKHAQDLENQRARVYGDKNPPNVLSEKNIAARKYNLGQLLAQDSGEMSTYHTFRTAVTTRQKQGQYDFLTKEETPLDLYQSVFRFEYLRRPTTYIPLGIGAAIAYLQVHSALPSDRVKDAYRSSDAFFTAANGFSAGSGEEAVFRGYMMPVLREYTGSDLWSNGLQGVIFAAAHLNNIQTPIIQLLFGWDLGYLSQQNSWTLGEGVFIHAWWDVIAFWATYQTTWKYEKSPLAVRPVLWLPPMTWQF